MKKSAARWCGTITLAAAAANVAKRNGKGLKAEYFNNADCSGEPALTRTDKLVFDSQAKVGNFEGAFNQDGSTVGNVRVKLQAGERLDLRLECGFKRGSAAIALSHDTPTLDRRAILPEFLHPGAGSQRGLAIVADKRPKIIADFNFEDTGVIELSRAGGDVFGRLTGNTRRVAGKIGNAIDFESQGGFAPAQFPIDEELRLPDADYTIAFWFKTKAANVRLCEAKRYSSYNNRWSDHVVQLANGKVQFNLQGDDSLETPLTLNDGQWHHVVTTVGSGGQRLFMDGKLIDIGKLSKRTQTSNRLGLDLGPGEVGAVTIDELLVLGKAIDATSVAELFEQQDK